MNKNSIFKLNNSHNRILIISLIFAILLVSSSFTYLFAQEGPWTVTFETGDGTLEGNRSYYLVDDGTLLGEIENVDLSDPVPKPNYLFVGWAPAIDVDMAVKFHLTYTAQWITDFSTPSPTIEHKWSLVLNNPMYIPWSPVGMLNLTFNDVSNSGQTYLDYAYMDISDEGFASIYFLCLTRNTPSNDYLTYMGVPGTKVHSATVLKSSNGDDDIFYSVWRVDLSEYMVRTILTGGTLQGSFTYFQGNRGNSINGRPLSFTNVRIVAEHYLYTNDPTDAVLYKLTPVVGVVNQFVTANPIVIIGGAYVYDDDASSATKSGFVPESGSLTLKLYYKPSDGPPRWEIRSTLEGLEDVHTVYNGAAQKLSDFIDPKYWVDGHLFTIEWPKDASDPAAIYVLVGGVLEEDPEYTDVGVWPQDLHVNRDYKIYYHGVYMTGDENSWYKPFDDGLWYEDITFVMGTPLSVPVSLIIEPVFLSIETGSASKVYDGSALTKTTDPPTIKGSEDLARVVVVPYVFTDTSNSGEYVGVLVNGETVGFVFTGTQTSLGISPNSYNLLWANSNPDNTYSAMEKNYFIVSITLGELDVYGTVTYYANFPEGVDGCEGTTPVVLQPYYQENGIVSVLGKGDLVVPRYRFIGWNMTLDETEPLYVPGDMFDMPDGNVVLYAQWVKEYTVVYASGLHGYWDDETETYTDYLYGEPLNNHPFSHDLDLDHEFGWVFKCWTDNDGHEYLTTRDLPDTVTCDVIYTAQWDAVVYEIEYVLAGGVNGGGNPDDYTVEDLLLRFVNATRTGYVFLGWTIVYAESGGAVDGIWVAGVYEVEGVMGDLTVTAQWTARTDLSYVVNYLEQGTGKVLADQKVVDTGVVFGTDVTEEAIDITGYDKVVPVSVTITVAVEGNVIDFYYTSSDVEYVVRYYLWETEFSIAEAKVVSGQVVGGVVSLVPDEFEGYSAVDPMPVTMTLGAEGNVFTFYYLRVDEFTTWYVVHYYLDGTTVKVALDKVVIGTVGDVVTVVAVDVAGYVVVEPVSLSGVLGVGGSNVFVFYYVVDVDVEVPTFSVVYDVSGGSGSFVDDAVYGVGDVVRVLSGVPAKVGFTFGGWLYDGEVYRGGDTFTMPEDGGVLLVAVWSANTYTVTYAPGAQGTFVSQSHAGLLYGVNTPAFSGGTPTGNSGYTFSGWSPSVASTVTGDVTYTAQWTYTGSSNDGSSSNGGSGGSSKSKSSPAPAASVKPNDDPLVVVPSPPPASVDPVEEPEFTWALLNLVLGVVGVVLAVVLVVFVLLWRNKDQKKEKDQIQQTNQKDAEQKQRRTLLLLTAVAMGIVSIVVFFLTEDMSHKMAWIDNWTILHAVLFIVEIIAITFTFKTKKDKTNTNNNNTNKN